MALQFNHWLEVEGTRAQSQCPLAAVPKLATPMFNRLGLRLAELTWTCWDHYVLIAALGADPSFRAGRVLKCKSRIKSTD